MAGSSTADYSAITVAEIATFSVTTDLTDGTFGPGGNHEDRAARQIIVTNKGTSATLNVTTVKNDQVAILCDNLQGVALPMQVRKILPSTVSRVLVFW